MRSRKQWLYVVLTFDPSTRPEGLPGALPWCPATAYTEAGSMWDKRLKRRLERDWGRLEYLATWERTRRGWPHANYLVGFDGLAGVLERDTIRERVVQGPDGRERTARYPRRMRAQLRRAAIGSGFGRVVWLELIDDTNPDALAGYLVKLAHELVGSPTGGKSYQAPLDAPAHFRRIRASRGLLPKIEPAGGDWTGALGLVSPREAPAWPRATRAARTSTDAEWADVGAAIKAAAAVKRRRHRAKFGGAELCDFDDIDLVSEWLAR